MASKNPIKLLAPAAAVATAQLRLDVTAFNAVVPNGQFQFCPANLTLNANGGGLVSAAGSQIYVTGKADLAITITSSVGVFFPVGVALIQTSNPPGAGNPNDPQGYTNFANISWTGTILQFSNN